MLVILGELPQVEQLPPGHDQASIFPHRFRRHVLPVAAAAHASAHGHGRDGRHQPAAHPARAGEDPTLPFHPH